MDTGKTYYDTEGNERTIWQMVKREPEWAANRIQVGESAIADVKRLRAENERLRDVLGDAHGVICNQEDQLRRLVDCEDIACEGVILDIRAILPNASHQTVGRE